LSPTTRRLLTVRALRSVGQGALVVAFTLYLRQLGWTAVHIGLLLTGGGLLNALASLLVGTISDRYGAKPFLLVYEAFVVVAGVIGTATSYTPLLAAAALIGSFGRGQNGSAGPFSPAEGAWLAEDVASDDRGRIYSLNSAIGFFGMAIGAGAAGLLPLWARWLTGPLAYRPLFILTIIGAVASAVVLQSTPGGHGSLYREQQTQEKQPPGEPLPEAPARRPRSEENRMLLLLMLTNAFNGVAIGLTGPLIAYWFNIKFGVGPGKIGAVFVLTFVLTGLASMATGELTRVFGVVGSVLAARLVGLVLLVLLPLAPTYWMAAALFIFRSAFNRSTGGARQALAVELVAPTRRGLAISLNMVSNQLPSSAGPTVAGYLIQEGALALPFYAAAGLQLIYLIMYVRLFRAYDIGKPKRPA